MVRLAIGPPGGGMYPLGQRLAAHYGDSVANTRFVVEESSGTHANAAAVALGDAELGLVWADVAYFGYAGYSDLVSERFDQVRGIAVLQLTPIHLVARSDRGINSIRDLRGRRVGIGPFGSGTSLTATLVLGVFDVSEVRTETLAFNEASRQLVEGSLDAIFVGGIYPAEAVIAATRGGGRLLPLAGSPIDALRHQYPFLRPTSIPARTYPQNDRPTHTIGVDLLLVCRSSLEDGLVYTLTEQFFDALPSLAAIQHGLRFMDVDQASATPIPLHPGAAQYYREQELRR